MDTDPFLDQSLQSQSHAFQQKMRRSSYTSYCQRLAWPDKLYVPMNRAGVWQMDNTLQSRSRDGEPFQQRDEGWVSWFDRKESILQWL